MQDRQLTKLLLLASLFLLIGCAHQPSSNVYGDSPGFFSGLLHGLLIVPTFIGSFFTDVRIYAFPNTGVWYDAGYLAGVLVAGLILLLGVDCYFDNERRKANIKRSVDQCVEYAVRLEASRKSAENKNLASSTDSDSQNAKPDISETRPKYAQLARSIHSQASIEEEKDSAIPYGVIAIMLACVCLFVSVLYYSESFRQIILDTIGIVFALCIFLGIALKFHETWIENKGYDRYLFMLLLWFYFDIIVWLCSAKLNLSIIEATIASIVLPLSITALYLYFLSYKSSRQSKPSFQNPLAQEAMLLPENPTQDIPNHQDEQPEKRDTKPRYTHLARSIHSQASINEEKDSAIYQAAEAEVAQKNKLIIQAVKEVSDFCTILTSIEGLKDAFEQKALEIAKKLYKNSSASKGEEDFISVRYQVPIHYVDMRAPDKVSVSGSDKAFLSIECSPITLVMSDTVTPVTQHLMSKKYIIKPDGTFSGIGSTEIADPIADILTDLRLKLGSNTFESIILPSFEKE